MFHIWDSFGCVPATARSPHLPAPSSALPLDGDGWPAGQQRYSVLLNDQGGIDDDLMLVLRPDLAEGPEIRMVVNASNRRGIWRGSGRSVRSC